MEITSDFTLPMPPEAAYGLLLDLDQVAPCMPGATLGAEREDGSRELNVVVRLGPMKFVYGGTVRVVERDDAARRAVLVGAAEETRGQGAASATITMSVSEDAEGGSRVDSVAAFDLTGRAAQTGRGIVEDVARRMVNQMAACLAERSPLVPAPAGAADVSEPSVAAPSPRRAPETTSEPEPIRAGAVLLSLLRERVGRLWRRLVARRG